MTPAILVLVIAVTVIALLIGLPLWRAQQRRRLRNRLLPTEWRTVVERALPLYARMPPDLRARLDGLIQQFVAEKEFVGCRGLAVTLEMKLAVASQACLLTLNRGEGLYDELYSVLLYPAAFVAPQEEQDEAGVVTQHESLLTGEAWETHRIVLSWDDVQASAHQPGTGYNVVFHEFAHYLDAEDGGANGAPWLGDAARYERWSKVMTEEYERLCAAAERGEETLLDPYGAEEPAEFFAVATESFFAQPVEMKSQHPLLYAELAGYYRLDPSDWANPEKQKGLLRGLSTGADSPTD